MNQPLVIVVPVRSLRGGKTRLAGVLPPGERSELVADLLTHVLVQAAAARVADALLVVSPDEMVLELAAAVHPAVIGLLQSPHAPGLNGALDLGRDWAREHAAARLMTLFADLPLLKPADPRELAAFDSPVVIAPDRHGTGTNSLLLDLQGAAGGLPFAFGERSASRHVAAATRLGITPVVHQNAGIGFDLDTPDDLDLLRLQSDRSVLAANLAVAPWDILASLAAGAGAR